MSIRLDEFQQAALHYKTTIAENPNYISTCALAKSIRKNITPTALHLFNFNDADSYNERLKSGKWHLATFARNVLLAIRHQDKSLQKAMETIAKAAVRDNSYNDFWVEAIILGVSIRGNMEDESARLFLEYPHNTWSLLLEYHHQDYTDNATRLIMKAYVVGLENYINDPSPISHEQYQAIHEKLLACLQKHVEDDTPIVKVINFHWDAPTKYRILQCYEQGLANGLDVHPIHFPRPELLMLPPQQLSHLKTLFSFERLDTFIQRESVTQLELELYCRVHSPEEAVPFVLLKEMAYDTEPDRRNVINNAVYSQTFYAYITNQEGSVLQSALRYIATENKETLTASEQKILHDYIDKPVIHEGVKIAIHMETWESLYALAVNQRIAAINLPPQLLE